MTLEPCCHQGKTPPCAGALGCGGRAAGGEIAQQDPFPRVAGAVSPSSSRLGIRVEVGIGADEARRLNTFILKLVGTGRPCKVIAKWAIDARRQAGHGERRQPLDPAARPRERSCTSCAGRVDAVLVGRGTAEADDPQLTARPAGVRTADARSWSMRKPRLARVARWCALAREVPVLVAVGEAADAQRRGAADRGRLRGASLPGRRSHGER